MENEEYREMIERMTAVFEADRISQLLEEDARRFDKSFSNGKAGE